MDGWMGLNYTVWHYIDLQYIVSYPVPFAESFLDDTLVRLIFLGMRNRGNMFARLYNINNVCYLICLLLSRTI